LPSSNIESKRNILQDSSQIFDPLEWATPVTICAKILLQEVWQRKCQWGTPIDEDITSRWLSIRSDILKFSNLILPKSYFPHLTGRVIDCIYVFADASTKAYSAVIYLLSNSEVSFVMFKSWVVPIKALTLPRLELMAAVTATKFCSGFSFSS